MPLHKLNLFSLQALLSGLACRCFDWPIDFEMPRQNPSLNFQLPGAEFYPEVRKLRAELVERFVNMHTPLDGGETHCKLKAVNPTLYIRTRTDTPSSSLNTSVLSNRDPTAWRETLTERQQFFQRALLHPLLGFEKFASRTNAGTASLENEWKVVLFILSFIFRFSVYSGHRHTS